MPRRLRDKSPSLHLLVFAILCPFYNQSISTLIQSSVSTTGAGRSDVVPFHSGEANSEACGDRTALQENESHEEGSAASGSDEVGSAASGEASDSFVDSVEAAASNVSGEAGSEEEAAGGSNDMAAPADNEVIGEEFWARIRALEPDTLRLIALKIASFLNIDTSLCKDIIEVMEPGETVFEARERRNEWGISSVRSYDFFMYDVRTLAQQLHARPEEEQQYWCWTRENIASLLDVESLLFRWLTGPN